MVEFRQKMAKFFEFSPFFGYRRIGHLGRIFGTKYSAEYSVFDGTLTCTKIVMMQDDVASISD